MALSSAGQKSPVGSCRTGVFCVAWGSDGRGASGVIHTSPVGASASLVSGPAEAMTVIAIQAAAAGVILSDHAHMEAASRLPSGGRLGRGFLRRCNVLHIRTAK
jgi:hypothetical protein